MTKQRRYLIYAAAGIGAGGLALLLGVSVSTVVVVGLFLGMMLMHGGHGGQASAHQAPSSSALPQPGARPRSSTR